MVLFVCGKLMVPKIKCNKKRRIAILRFLLHFKDHITIKIGKANTPKLINNLFGSMGMWGIPTRRILT